MIDGRLSGPRRDQGKARSRRLLALLVLLALAGVLLLTPFVLGLLRYGSPLEYFRRQAFDSRTWRSSISEDARIRMIDDLVDDVLRVGMTSAEIAALLGPTPQTSYFGDRDLVYRLGMERSLFSIDSEWLVIRFGPEGRVTEFQIVRD